MVDFFSHSSDAVTPPAPKIDASHQFQKFEIDVITKTTIELHVV